MQKIVNSTMGNINIKINTDSNITAEYNSSLVEYVIMIREFIILFCRDYDIDINDYYEYLDYAWKQFVKDDCSSKMNVIKK